jgi:hypothetical protein
MQTITFTSERLGTYNVPATPASVHNALVPQVVEVRPRSRARRKLVLRRARAWARADEFAQADRVLTVDEPAGCARADARHEAECAVFRCLAILTLDGLSLGELAWAGRALGTPRWYGGRDYHLLVESQERARAVAA